MWIWDEKTCCGLVLHMLDRLAYPEAVEQITWLSRVASSDDHETELRLVVKVCSANNAMVLRIDSSANDHVLERIGFQIILHQKGLPVPAVWNVVEVALSEQLTVTAYLEEYIEGSTLSEDDFIRYVTLLGRLHDCSKHLTYAFSVKRNHLLYDTQRIAEEMKDRLCIDSAELERLIQFITALMLNTKEKMMQLRRHPVHGDYSTNNIIRNDDKLFLIDFGMSGYGYLPEEAGEAFAEIVCTFLHFHQWEKRLNEFLSAYCSMVSMSELEMELTRAVAKISMVIRVLHTDINGKTMLFLCRNILEE